MQPFIIRDRARVRSYVLVMVVSLILLAGWIVVRAFVGPPEQIPPTMYALVAALVVAWNVSGIVSRSALLRIDRSGITSGRDHLPWTTIRSAQAVGGELIVTADRRRTVPIGQGRDGEVNAALADHRRAARDERQSRGSR